MNSDIFETFFFTVVSPPSVHMKPVNLLIHPLAYLCKKHTRFQKCSDACGRGLKTSVRQLKDNLNN